MLHLKNNTINAQIDTSCLQTNVVSARVAALLRQDGKDNAQSRRTASERRWGDNIRHGRNYGRHGFVEVYDIRDS